MWFVVLQPCQGQPCDCFEHLLVITLSTWAEPLRKKNGAHNVAKRGIRIMLLLLGIPPKLIFEYFLIISQKCNLMESSAQISSGVRRRGSQEQVPEEKGSGGLGSGRFQGSGVCWCRFRRQVAEASSGGKGRVPARAGVGSRGKFQKIPRSRGKFRKVPEGSGACWCRFRRLWRVPES